MEYVRLVKIVKNLDIQGLSDDEIILKIALKLEPNFQMNADCKLLYDQLKYYFNKDKNFNGNLNKGLLLLGGFGTGKTLAFQIFWIYNHAKQNNRFYAIFDTDEIIDSYTKNGRPSIDQYNGDYDITIDELGQDSGKHYYFGSIDDPVDILLGRRYIRYKESGLQTHAASNLDVNQLKERFSGKIYDRMNEMFNIVPFAGESWRQKK